MNRPPALDVVDRFRLFYRTNYWGDNETVSGDSSRTSRTSAVAGLLIDTIFPCGITLVDVGCGDCNWMRKLELHESMYVGLDVVPELIKANHEKYGSTSRKFAVIDARNDEIPAGDVILIRDVLPHLSDDDVMRTLAGVRRSRPSLLVASTYRGAKGERDLLRSNHASIDLELDRYGLGAARWFLPEDVSGTNAEEVRGLAIWSMESDIASGLVERVANDLHSLQAESGVLPALGAKTASDLKGFDKKASWSVRVDGRGYAYVSSDASLSGSHDQLMRVSPSYVPVSHVERRLTKRGTSPQEGGLIIGSSCVGRVVADPSLRFSEGELVLIPPSIDDTTHIAGPGVSNGDGYLQEVAQVDPSVPVLVDESEASYLWLLAVPLTVALEVRAAVRQIAEDSPGSLGVHVWGAGTIGLLIADRLSQDGFTVSVSDIYPASSWIGRSVQLAGAKYYESAFDHTPDSSQVVVIDASADRYASSTRNLANAKLLIRVSELDGTALDPSQPSSQGVPTVWVAAYNPRWKGDAVGILRDSAHRSLWAEVVSQVYPRGDYDIAIFPSEPTRMHIVATAE